MVTMILRLKLQVLYKKEQIIGKNVETSSESKFQHVGSEKKNWLLNSKPNDVECALKKESSVQVYSF